MIGESKQIRFERLLSDAKSHLRSHDEDAISEASLALWESLSLHVNRKDAAHIRTAVNAGRKSLRMRVWLPLDAEPACFDNLAASAIVEDLLAVLPDSQRRAFVYRCLDGLSAAIIGGLLGMTERNVYYLIVKAKRRLWKEIS